MKSKKWIWVTLTILLTLIVLVGVAGASFRMGAMQGANLARNADGLPAGHPPIGPMHNFEKNFNDQQGRNPHMMQGFDQRGGPGMMQGFGHRGFGRGFGGFFSPLFGLVHLLLLGGLIWLVFILIKNSGWRITRVAQTAPVPSPAASETPSVDEKKE